MNKDRRDASADILSLAWAFYQAPLRYPGLIQADLPPAVDTLLRVAGDDGQLAETYSQATGARTERLREAALFFIEQVFFAPQSDHYRVLGLNPQATPEQVKDHYRLLMRLFHPDRHSVQEGWTDVYAERVNQAYRVLRRPDSRREYDKSLKVAAPSSVNRQPVDSRRSSTSVLRPSILRHYPQAVLLGMTLLAILVVLGIYGLGQQTPVYLTDQEWDGELFPRAEENLADVSLPAAEHIPPAVPIEVEPRLVLIPYGEEIAYSPGLSTDLQPISMLELEILVGRFIRTYEQGDLEGFLALFGETGPGGKLEITKAYRNIFYTTLARHMSLKHLRWDRTGVSAHGKGSVLIRAQYPGERYFRNSSGSIHVDIIKRDDRLLITRLRYNAGQHSERL